MQNYKITKSHYFWKPFLFPILGSLISAITYVVNISLDFWVLSIRPVHLLILLLWLIGIETIARDLGNKVLLFIGIAFGIVSGYMTNNGLFFGSFTSVLYILFGGIIGSIIIIPGALRNRKTCQKYGKKSLPWSILWSTLAIALVAIFRILNIIFRDVPNEERSFMIGGIEIHHFVTGLLFMGLSFAVLYNFKRSKAVTTVFSGVLVICLAMIADQISYILIFPLSDDAFFSLFSLLGAIISMSWLIFRINFFSLKGRK